MWKMSEGKRAAGDEVTGQEKYLHHGKEAAESREVRVRWAGLNRVINRNISNATQSIKTNCSTTTKCVFMA